MRSVLVTGGSGSFGHAVVKRLLEQKYPPDRIIVYSRDEQKQDQMARKYGHSNNLRFFIGDVRDESRLTMAMRGIDMVFHAAALKIVPIAEYNPFEVVQTNIHGAENVVRAAINSGVKKVIALSTDKAVNPINLYGATKLAAEKIFVAANNLSAGATGFSVVRYGNVVGSRGSVVPLFTSLVAEGKPLTITDRRMPRFWIEMDHAVDFILRCSDQARGREIFIPRIPSVKITDLALAFQPEVGWAITGIRPGEKIHETLMTEDEARFAWENNEGFVILPSGKPKMFVNKVHDGFRYSSDTNTHWLTAEQLKSWAQGSTTKPQLSLVATS